MFRSSVCFHVWIVQDINRYVLSIGVFTLYADLRSLKATTKNSIFQWRSAKHCPNANTVWFVHIWHTLSLHSKSISKTRQREWSNIRHQKQYSTPGRFWKLSVPKYFSTWSPWYARIIRSTKTPPQHISFQSDVEVYDILRSSKFIFHFTQN